MIYTTDTEKGKTYIQSIISEPGINELLDLILNRIVSNSFSVHSTISIVGGAIIDSLESRKPNDYDILFTHELYNFCNSFMKFKSKTQFSTTYIFNNHKIQLLHRDINNFDYTISKSCLRIFPKKDKDNHLFKYQLELDELSFFTKTLIPNSFEDKDMVERALMRIPHYRKKGYNIPDETYLSLLYSLFKLQRNNY